MNVERESVGPGGGQAPGADAPRSDPGLLAWFKPAPHRPRLPAGEVDQRYPRYRWRIFESAFVAYATFYLVRNNFAPVSKEIGAALHYDKTMIGNLLAGTAIAYGSGKLVMGYLADRSDSRKYIAVGMLLTACLNFLFGATANYEGHLLLWTLNGFVQGMGYGPCTRGLAHWYSVKERGTIFGVWNTSHCIGGGIAGYLAAACAQHWGWQSAFYVPGAIAAVCAIYLFWRVRDTPQSEGLPPIEEYKNDWPPGEGERHERELSFRETFLHYILPNKMLWVLACANIFVYIARYAMVDWGPTYLKEVKGASLVGGGFSTLVIEFAGAVGMIVMGRVSDKMGGRRARLSAIAMMPLPLAFLGLIWAPANLWWLNLVLFGVIGFFVYTPVTFSGVVALDLTSKKAQATAAGFVGFFGYVGGRVIQGIGLGWVAQHYGWNAGLYAIIGCILMGIVLLAFLWNVRPRG
ncbi:MAG TPA: MFS transporter [Candidatus Binatia bacterium]|jgi:OPA family glycerol-3-phosphate transporter-like MFS transporter|nr:MFS transporter [Candidatus Binatia bacterium]